MIDLHDYGPVDCPADVAGLDDAAVAPFVRGNALGRLGREE